MITLHGSDWHTHPRSVGRFLLCLLGRHARIMSALDDGLHVERCSCGAISLNHGRHWSPAENIWPRRGTVTPVDTSLEAS